MSRNDDRNALCVLQDLNRLLCSTASLRGRNRSTRILVRLIRAQGHDNLFCGAAPCRGRQRLVQILERLISARRHYNGRDLVELVKLIVYEDQLPFLLSHGTHNLDAGERIDLAHVLVEHEDHFMLCHPAQFAGKECCVQTLRDLEPREHVHIVRPDHGAEELLEHIVVLVGCPDRAKTADLLGTMLVPDHLEIGRDDRQRLVPRTIDEFAANAHLRCGKPFGMMGSIPTEPAFRAEVVVPCGAYPHDLTITRFIADATAAAAIIANRRGPLKVPRPGLVLELARGERPHGADLDALAAELAVEWPVKIGADARPRSAAGEGPLPHAVLFVADPDALAAEDAAADVALDDRTLIIRREISLLGVEPALPETVLVHQVLELALACLVADRTIEGVLDQKQLEHHPPRLDQRRRRGPNDHVVRCWCCARWRELARRTLDLNEADAACAEWMELVVMTQYRYPRAGRVCRFEDSRSERDLDLFSVNRYRYFLHLIFTFFKALGCQRRACFSQSTRTG